MEPVTQGDCVDVVSRHIVKTPGVMRGRARIDGTRVRVMDLAAYVRGGESVESLIDGFPWLSPASIYAALAYYEDNKEEIEQAYAEDHAFAEQFAREHPETVRYLPARD